MKTRLYESRRGKCRLKWAINMVLSALLLGTVGTGTAASETHTVIAVADSYVLSTNANANFGATNLVVQKNVNQEFQSYIKFDLSSLFGTSVISAKLRVRLRSNSVAHTIKVYSCNDDSWTNGGITWNNKPAAGTQQASIDLTTTLDWYEVDITSWAASQFAGDKLVTVILMDDQSQNRNSQYYGIETGAGAYEPRLVIEVEGAPESKTISGTVTLNGTGLAGVTMTGLPGNPVTAGDGSYSGTVMVGTNATVAPSRTGFSFEPASRTYNNIQDNHTSQDYTAEVLHMDAWQFYSPNSYYSFPIQQAPVDPNSDHYIASWKASSTNQNLRMGGMDGTYGFQLFFGTASDPSYTVTNTNTGEVFTFRGPSGMAPSPGDGELVCVDTTQDGGNGVLYAFGGINDLLWSLGVRNAAFSSVQYVKSNGIDGWTSHSDDLRNNGHRGLPMLCFGPMVSEVQAMHIPHLIKLVVYRTGKSPYLKRKNHVWTYVGNEGDTTDLPEGARVRLKASVQPRIDAMENPYARAIAQAFLTYGAIIGDQGGQGATTNMQTGPGTAAAWAAMGITGTSLYEFTIDDFEVVELGWVPPGM